MRFQITFSRLEKDTALATSVVKGQRQQPHQDQPQDEDATPTQRSTSPSHAKRERNASPVPKSHLSSNSSSPLHSKPHPPEATDGITLLDKQNEGGETGGSPQAGSQGLAEAVPPTVLEGVLPEVLEVLTSETPEVATNGRLGGEDGDGEVSDALTVRTEKKRGAPATRAGLWIFVFSSLANSSCTGPHWEAGCTEVIRS